MEGTQPSPRGPHARDAQPGRPTSCLGMLYYSQSRYERQKEPVCAGVRRWHAANRGAGELPTEAIPGGDFKYVCLGYSAYDTAKLKAEAARRTGTSDGVHVPYCEGLEIISAAAMSGKPELLTSGPDVGAASASRSAAEPRHQRPARTFVPGGAELQPGAMDWEKYKERFGRISRRILDKMQSNASYIAAVTKRSWQQLTKDAVDKGRDR